MPTREYIIVQDLAGNKVAVAIDEIVKNFGFCDIRVFGMTTREIAYAKRIADSTNPNWREEVD